MMHATRESFEARLRDLARAEWRDPDYQEPISDELLDAVRKFFAGFDTPLPRFVPLCDGGLSCLFDFADGIIHIEFDTNGRCSFVSCSADSGDLAWSEIEENQEGLLAFVRALREKERCGQTEGRER